LAANTGIGRMKVINIKTQEYKLMQSEYIAKISIKSFHISVMTHDEEISSHSPVRGCLNFRYHKNLLKK
jgi:hypothetical protein